MKPLDIPFLAGFVVFIVALIVTDVILIVTDDDDEHHCFTKQDLVLEAVEEGWTQEELSKLNELLGKSEEDN